MQSNVNIFENYDYYSVWSTSLGDAEFNKNIEQMQAKTTVMEDSS
jgi:hypothetical protein